MSLPFKYISDSFVNKIVNSAIKELNKYFGFKLGYEPSIFILPDRQSINAARRTIPFLKNEETPKHIDAWIYKKNLYILSRINYNEESQNNYNEEYYISLINHELIHFYVNVLTKENFKPDWMIEGVSIYLSNQLKFHMKPQILDKFLDCFDPAESDSQILYSQSGFAVQVLIEKHGKKQFIKLLKQLAQIQSKEDFNKRFENIYGFRPEPIYFNQ